MNEATKKKAVARIQAALGQLGEVVLRAFVQIRLSGVDAGERKPRIDELMDVLARYPGLGRRTHDAG
jgi:hypothetical protein